MKILFLTPDVPLPADQGGKLRNLALLRAAAEHHQVDLLSFCKEEPAAEHRHELERLCRRVELVPTPHPRSFLHRAWSLWFDPLPDLAFRLESPDYRARLWDLTDHEHYDVAQIEGLEMMPYISAARGGTGSRTALVYDAHNAEMSLQRSIWQAELRDPRRWLPGLYSLTQWSKLGTYERVMMNSTDMVLAVSEEDAAKLKGRHVDPLIVPNGIDAAALPYCAPTMDPGATLLFVGPLDYRPNDDAVRWLVRQIFPLVRQRKPDARLRLVGRGTERIQAAGVDAVGYVEDIGAEFARADVLLAPLRMGGGTRLKVLEAMARGVPVVSTPVGLAGIAAEPGKHALLARTPPEFATAVIEILEDREIARKLAGLARLLVEGRYDWSKITPAYLRHLTTARRLARSRD